MPVAASTVSTRSAGMRSQFDTEGCEMPIRRASSLTPPAARMASCRPGSRMCSILGQLRFFLLLEAFETVMAMQRYGNSLKLCTSGLALVYGRPGNSQRLGPRDLLGQ